MKLKIFYTLLIALTFIGSYFLYENTFNHFKLEYISYAGESGKEWNFAPLNAEKQQLLENTFSKPFSYLGEGHQSYAFLSHDGRYVLKFFKFKKARKVERIFIGYGLAYTYDRENCGLLFVHLHPTQNLKKQIIVNDRIGRSHSIDLDQFIFVVQEKATTSNEVIGKLLIKNDINKAKQCINQIIDLYVSEYKQGLFDADHNVMHNSGFVEGRFIRTDVGKLVYDPSYSQDERLFEDLQKIAWERIDKWVERYFPQYREEIRQELSNKLQAIHLSLNEK